MKNNNPLEYSVIDASSFVSVVSGALIPDAMIGHFSEETPWFVKQAVEQLFFGGRKMGDLESREAADAFVINALIAMQRDIKNEYGEADWEGMLEAYIMPDEYTRVFLKFEECGGFSAAFDELQQEQREVSPWDKRGYSLN